MKDKRCERAEVNEKQQQQQRRCIQTRRILIIIGITAVFRRN